MADRRRYNRRRRVRGRFRGLYRFAVVLLAFAAVLAGCIVFFRVRTVRVEGMSRYTTEEVAAVSGVEEGSYLALLDTARAARQIRSQLPYVERASVRRILPDTVVITVEECSVAIAVQDKSQWWLVNDAGKLLEAVTGQEAAGHPQLTGIELLMPAAGMSVVVSEEEENRWSCALDLLRTLEDRGDLSKLNSLDCSAPGEFTLRYDGRYTLLLPTTVAYEPTTQSEFSHFFALLDEALPELEGGEQDLVDFTLWESTGRIYARRSK